MRKYLSIHYILPAVLLVAFIFGMTLYFTGKNQDTITTSSEAAPVSNIAAETPIHTVELISEVPGFEPAPGQPVRDELVRMLDEIHFWDGVVISSAGQEDITQINHLVITLTSNIQEGNVVYKDYTNQTLVMSSDLSVINDTGHLKIYVDRTLITTRILKAYLLKTLFRYTYWPRSMYIWDSENYANHQSRFIEDSDYMLVFFIE